MAITKSAESFSSAFRTLLNFENRTIFKEVMAISGTCQSNKITKSVESSSLAFRTFLNFENRTIIKEVMAILSLIPNHKARGMVRYKKPLLLDHNVNKVYNCPLNAIKTEMNHSVRKVDLR